MIYRFGDRLVPVTIEEWEADRSPAVFVTDSRHADKILAKAGIIYENEIHVSKIGFCRLENQQDCIVGTLCIPKLLDVLGSRYRMYFFVNRSNVVIIDDEDFSERLIRRIQQKKTRQGENKERFIYNYISEFISRDLEMLVAYERRLLRMEEDVSQEHISGFQAKLMPIRRELLNLRSYYDEIMDLTKELEENENGFFLKKHLKYFGTLTDRADRLSDEPDQPSAGICAAGKRSVSGADRCAAEQQYAVPDGDIHDLLSPDPDHRMVWHEFPRYAGA